MADGWFEAARRCLELAQPEAKCAAVRAFDNAFRSGDLGRDDDVPVVPIGEPGRPERPELVDPARVPRRRLGSAEGRAALVHAIAHIELNAVDLALDIVARFAAAPMPQSFFDGWMQGGELVVRASGLADAPFEGLELGDDCRWRLPDEPGLGVHRKAG